MGLWIIPLWLHGQPLEAPYASHQNQIAAVKSNEFEIMPAQLTATNRQSHACLNFGTALPIQLATHDKSLQKNQPSKKLLKDHRLHQLELLK